MKKIFFLACSFQLALHCSEPAQNITINVQEVENIKAHNKDILYVEYSPNGQYLSSCSEDKTVKIWNVNNLYLMKTLRHENIVFNLSWAPDSENLVSACRDSVNIWNIHSGKNTKMRKLNNEGPIRSVLWMNNDTYIVSLDWNHTIKLWQKDGTLIKIFEDYNAYYISLVNNLLIMFCNNRIKILNLATDETTVKYSHYEFTCHPVFSSNNQQLAIASNNKIHLVNFLNILQQNFTAPPLDGHTKPISCVQFSPDKRFLASSDKTTIKIWEPHKKQLLASIENAHASNITSLSWSPDSKRLASSSCDKRIKIWEINENN